MTRALLIALLLTGSVQVYGASLTVYGSTTTADPGSFSPLATLSGSNAFVKILMPDGSTLLQAVIPPQGVASVTNTTPFTPQNVTATLTGPTSATVSWQLPPGWWALSNAVSELIGMTPGTVTSFNVSGMTPGQTVYFMVTGIAGGSALAVTPTNPPPTSALAQINTGGFGNSPLGWSQDTWNAFNTSTMTISAAPGITNAPPPLILQDYAQGSNVVVGPITGLLPNTPCTVDIWLFECTHNAVNRIESITVSGSTTLTTNNVAPWALAGNAEFIAVDMRLTCFSSSNGTVTVSATVNPQTSNDPNAILGPVQAHTP